MEPAAPSRSGGGGGCAEGAPGAALDAIIVAADAVGGTTSCGDAGEPVGEGSMLSTFGAEQAEPNQTAINHPKRCIREMIHAQPPRSSGMGIAKSGLDGKR